MNSSSQWLLRHYTHSGFGKLRGLFGIPGRSTVDQISFLELVDRFCQGIVIAVVLVAAEGSMPTSVGRSLYRIATSYLNGESSSSPIWLVCPKSLHRCIKYKIRAHPTADALANNAPCEDIDHKVTYASPAGR